MSKAIEIWFGCYAIVPDDFTYLAHPERVRVPHMEPLSPLNSTGFQEAAPTIEDQQCSPAAVEAVVSNSSPSPDTAASPFEDWFGPESINEDEPWTR